jgi:hypothetical protein
VAGQDRIQGIGLLGFAGLGIVNELCSGGWSGAPEDEVVGPVDSSGLEGGFFGRVMGGELSDPCRFRYRNMLPLSAWLPLCFAFGIVQAH